jgi:hypothetical protein
MSSCHSQTTSCDLEKNEQALKERYEKDQEIRKKLMPLLAEYQKTGEGAFELIALVNKQNSIDADNQKFVEHLLSECGWSNELSSEGHKAIFMIIHHADDAFMNKYFPLVKEKSSLGLLEPDDYPMMLDRVLMNAGKAQIYGTQTFQGSDQKNYVWPIEDVENLQKRRDSISLPSMAEYFKISKEKYNIEMVWDKTLSLKDAIKMKKKK